jgi:hypothetical protein
VAGSRRCRVTVAQALILTIQRGNASGSTGKVWHRRAQSHAPVCVAARFRHGAPTSIMSRINRQRRRPVAHL